MKTKSLLLLAAFMLLLAPAGCIFSPDEDDPPPGGGPGDAGLQFADTRDKLMENFATVYDKMDYNGYRDMLHPDYITLLQAATQIDFPDVGETLDLAEELEIARKMFSGESGVNAKGEWAAPISSIQVAVLEQKTDWVVSLPNDRIPNAHAALFDVWFNLDRTGHSTFEVKGTLQFYVVSQDSFHSGANRTYWRMIGQQDFTGAK